VGEIGRHADEAHQARTCQRLTIMWRLMTVLALILSACGGPGPTPVVTPASTPSPSATDAAAQVTDTSGPFRLTFVLPRISRTSNEAITGEATLALTDGTATTIYGSGTGLLAFGFQEVGGARTMGPAWTLDCRSHPLAADQPMVSAITKSGGYSEEQPDAAFYRSFFWDPAVRLPAGTWDITAVAEFAEGAGCAGAHHALSATVRVHVTD